MGAGQIGGIATLLDMDFKNAATFIGEPAEPMEGQYIIHYLSHAMMFCMGVLIEAHVVLTPASCVHGERYKFNVLAGTHYFLENAGTSRMVQHLCVHKGPYCQIIIINELKTTLEARAVAPRLTTFLCEQPGYNTSDRWNDCSTDNLALLVLNQQISFHKREPGSDFLMNRVRYGISSPKDEVLYADTSCRYYGWGSRRNGYLIPLLIQLRRVDVTILSKDSCLAMFNYQEKFLCIQQTACRSEKFGALCPDDVGSVIVCSGFALGMMTSRLVDRPCGVGFLDLSKYSKFMTCGVDDSRDVLDGDEDDIIDLKGVYTHTTPEVLTLPPENDDDAEPTEPPTAETTTVET